ncbi:UbiA prenyltransferase family-domain-containing protein [Fomitopsis betulina]|nr:UbiA prenyltransferase family-domain-containing protein [Fomitopsis betulina]
MPVVAYSSVSRRAVNHHVLGPMLKLSMFTTVKSCSRTSLQKGFSLSHLYRAHIAMCLTYMKNTPRSLLGAVKSHVYWCSRFPSGGLFIFWPSVWGYLLSVHTNPPGLTTLMGYLIGLLVALLESAGCTINDICDRDFDRQVERCKNRPIASGAITILQATIFLLFQVAVFVWILTHLDQTAFFCGILEVFPLASLYPLMKRVTFWPQAWLGLAMNWGLPTAWLMTRPQDVTYTPMWVLLFGSLCWTIFYDTIYACQDKKDDVKAGVKSTALLFGAYIKLILVTFAAVFVCTLAYIGLKLDMSLPYFVIGVGGSAAHLAWQLCTLNVDIPEECGKKFFSNSYIITGGMLAAIYMPETLRI